MKSIPTTYQSELWIQKLSLKTVPPEKPFEKVA